MVKASTRNVPYGESLYVVVHDDRLMINLGKIIARENKENFLHFAYLEKRLHQDFIQNFLIACIGKKIEISWGNSGLVDELASIGYEMKSIPSIIEDNFI